MDAFQVLVIILSVTLFVALIVGMVLTVLLIKIMKQIKRVTDAVEKTVDSAHATVESVKRWATPALFQALVEKIVNFANEKKEERDGKKR
jgi:uncharacterized protein YoxC